MPEEEQQALSTVQEELGRLEHRLALLDGTKATADWIVGCDPCSQAAEFNAMAIVIRDETTWVGNDPVIPESN